jgi:predicted protein tyrosine phosphatase
LKVETLRRILFVCSQNRFRSPTAAETFADWPDIETDSAGTADDAVTSVEQIEWADIIIVMEQHHARKIKRRFAKLLKDKRVIVLGIRDEYDYQHPDLIRLLKAAVPPFLR